MSACQLADIAQEKYSQAYLGMPEAMPMAPPQCVTLNLGKQRELVAGAGRRSQAQRIQI